MSQPAGDPAPVPRALGPFDHDPDHPGHHDAPAAPSLCAYGVSVRYEHREVVHDVTFELLPGDVVALIGPNGAGKSTLLKALVGLVAHTGEVHMHGRRCHHREHRQRAAFVPQRLDLDLEFPIAVSEVVLAGRRLFGRWTGRPSARDHEAVSSALDRVGLAGIERRHIGKLSGGQLQRVLVARALAQEADILLLDEAMSGVDRPTVDALVDLFDALAAEGTTVLCATHDLALARSRFRRCLALNRRLIADGPPEAVLHAAVLDETFSNPDHQPSTRRGARP